jgi:hypothetical protein
MLILFGNKNAILAPGKHWNIVWHCQSNCGGLVPEVPEVPQVPQKMFHMFPKFHKFRWYPNLFGNSVLHIMGVLLYILPNNIRMTPTGITYVKSFNKTLTD